MPKIAKEMHALGVKNLTKSGLHAVGGVSGLYLSVGDKGSRSWILRTMIGSKRHDIGLGSYPSISLAMARTKSTEIKESIKNGENPIALRRQKKSLIEWTFKRCADEFIKMHRDSWKNLKHGQQWVNTLDTYVNPIIGDLHVRDIDVGHVLAVIEPDWKTKNETMVRIRNRIELILSWAAVRGYRPIENPARWRGNLDATLPKPSTVNKRTSHKSLPFEQIQSFIAQLRNLENMSARCLELLIATATRSGEAREAQWVEFDLENAIWTIPASRMKAGREHRVPLNSIAINLIRELPRFEGNDFLFQGSNNKPLSDMALTQLLRRMKVNAVPHGFRSTFTVWAAEKTTYPSELREMALAHAVKNKTEAVYQRGDLFERRINLMNDWASFIETIPTKETNVIPLRKEA
jgi:integrase